MTAASLFTTPAFAQDRAAEINQIFQWATPQTPGAAVAVAHRGEVVFDKVYGLANLGEGVPIKPETRFDVGSVVKQFVAASVLLPVEDGRVALSDDIREHIPELPDYGHTITVDHLLMHTSGLRDWTGLRMLSSEDDDALTLVLRQRGLNFQPGEEWSYSNSGYVLLKELVARSAGMPFSDFARRRLFEQLGMDATAYVEQPEKAENLAIAYEKQGDGWEQATLQGNDRGGGGALLSTAHDLLTWNEALSNARLGEFVTNKLQEPATLNNGRELDYARGLFLDTNRGGRVVWHSGSADGYKSMVARFPEQDLSIAIVSNAGESAERMMAIRRIYDLFVPPAANGAEGAEGAEPDEAAGVATAPNLEGKAGLFFNERDGEPLRLGVDGGQLRILGGPVLVAEGENRFRNPEGQLSFRSGDEFELHFFAPDEFELRSMEGETTRYRRARPYAPIADELQAFAGRYASDEMRAVLELAPGEQGLMLRLNDSPAFEFAPVDRNTFQRGRMMVRLRRDTDGRVVGLDYSNPVLRNITFTRTSDQE